MEFVCDTQNLAAIELFGRFSLQYCVIDTGYFVIIYILMFLLSSKFNLSASSRWQVQTIYDQNYRTCNWTASIVKTSTFNVLWHNHNDQHFIVSSLWNTWNVNTHTC